MEIIDLVKGIYEALEEKKADEISVIDIGGLSDIADYFVIATVNNNNQMDAATDAVDEYMNRHGIQAKNIEGHARDRSNWILMDYRDIIVHVFDRDARDFYNLERLWKDGKKVTF